MYQSTAIKIDVTILQQTRDDLEFRMLRFDRDLADDAAVIIAYTCTEMDSYRRSKDNYFGLRSEADRLATRSVFHLARTNRCRYQGSFPYPNLYHRVT